MNAKRLLALLLTLVMVFSFAACGPKTNDDGNAGTTATPDTNAGTTDDGNTNNGGETADKTLKVHIETEVMSLDSAAATDGTSFEVIADFTDGLYQADADGNAIPALAANTEISEDGLTYTFTIRDDAVWSNGTPVTADDFVYAWQRACDPNYASEYAFMIYEVAQIKNGYDVNSGALPLEELGVKAQDENTLVVELASPVSYFLSLLYFPTFYPVNREFCESCGDTYGTSASTVLANGAFIMTDDYAPAATSFTLAKNPDYYDADKIAIDGLNYQVIKDSQTALMAYQNGDLDIVTLSGEQVEQVSDDPCFATFNAGYLWYITVNLHDYDYLNNVNFRKALAAAYDRDALCATIVKDGSTGAYFPVPEKLATGPDGKDFREDAGVYDIGNLDDAKTYYADACAELGRNTFDIELLVEDDATAQNVAAYIQQQWNQLPGVTVTLKVETKKQRVEDIQNGNYNTCLTRWGPDYADPMTYLNMWVTGNSNTYGLWSNSEYDDLIKRCTSGDLAVDANARWEALQQAEKIVMDDMVILPVYQKKNAMMINSAVSGLECHAVALNRVFKNVTIG